MRVVAARLPAAQGAAWCEYLAAHARRLYAAVTDAARVAAALLATPALRRPAGEAVHRARGVYRQEWTSLTEPWVSCRARSSASKSWAGFARRRSGPRTADGPACGCTSTRGSPRSLKDPGARSAPGNRPNCQDEVLSVLAGTRRGS